MPANRKGGALLAVLWLSAALAAIAFSLATTVRGELERTSTAVDGARAYYLAEGALERALLYMQWGPQFAQPDGTSRYFSPWTTRLHFAFATGEAIVEIAPESAKLDINTARPDEILRLLQALGAHPEQAETVTAAILDWRTPLLQPGLGDFDHYYLSLNPSFRSRHSSFQELEELLLVRGMTPGLYFGSLERDAKGRLIPRGGLAECLTSYGDAGPVDVNSAPPAVFSSVGLDPQSVDAILQSRQVQPLRTREQLRSLGIPEELIARLAIGGGRTYTLSSTARLRLPDGKLSDLARSIGATVRPGGSGEPGYQVLRWHDRMWVRNTSWTQELSSQ